MKNPIVANIQRRAVVTRKRQELKDEAEKLRQDSKKINQEFISEQLESFLEELEHSKGGYTVGNVFFNFTHFVSRQGIYLNEEHSIAVEEFKEAKKKLAEVFVESLQENKNGERERIINGGEIKNIKDMEYYF